MTDDARTPEAPTTSAPTPEFLATLTAFVGARIDAVHANPDTGLIAISVYAGERRVLGVGIGPRVSGIGILPALPRFRATAQHPLVAALRAHLADHRVRNIELDDAGALWVAAGGEGAFARVRLVPGRRGELEVLSAEGRHVLRWPPPAPSTEPTAPASTDAISTAPSRPQPLPRDESELRAKGKAMLESSDKLAVEREHALLVRAVKKRIESFARRAEAVFADLARIDDVARLQKIGRLLLAQGPRIPRGVTKATLEDWEEGGSIEIALDPSQPAKPQAETFFARARRYQRGEAAMTKRLEETERVLTSLRALLTDIESAPKDPSALEPLVARARAQGVPLAQTAGTTTAGTSRAAKPSRKPFTMYRGARGEPLLVGRGGRDNDELITKHARPHDLWLHAKNLHGAHVIVPLEKGQSCPPELLVDAATLAVHHSDARDEAVCEVSYVERRYVRKPRGSAPGAVTFTHEKILTLRKEPDRLARLLSARDET